MLNRLSAPVILGASTLVGSHPNFSSVGVRPAKCAEKSSKLIANLSPYVTERRIKQFMRMPGEDKALICCRINGGNGRSIRTPAQTLKNGGSFSLSRPLEGESLRLLCLHGSTITLTELKKIIEIMPRGSEINLSCANVVCGSDFICNPSREHLNKVDPGLLETAERNGVTIIFVTDTCYTGPFRHHHTMPEWPSIRRVDTTTSQPIYAIWASLSSYFE